MPGIRLIRCLALVAVSVGLTLLVHSPVLASQPGPDARLEEMMVRRSLALHFPGPSTAANNRIASHNAPVGPNCRYGATTLSQSQVDWLPDLGAGWYLNFWVGAYSNPSPARFVPIVGVKQTRDGCKYLNSYSFNPPLLDNQLGSYIATEPGALWLIANEPDRGPNPENCLGTGQADTYPEVYARAYHDAYTFIKAHDPSAQVGMAGLVEVTPGRLQYLDKVWQSYHATYGTNMSVDVWNMHLYILPEALATGQPNGIANVALGTDVGLAMRESGGDRTKCGQAGIYCYADHDNMTVFAGQVIAMRTWMKAHGQQNKPLIISEFSQLYSFMDYDNPVNPTRCYLQDEFGKCFTAQRVTNFLNKSFSYLANAADVNLGYPSDYNRLVQQWMWFSVYLGPGGAGDVSNLLTNDLAGLSAVGQAYRTAVQAQPLAINLLPEPAPAVIAGYAPPTGGTDTVAVTLSARVRNNGNTATTVPITVTFYADSAFQNPIGSAVIPAGLSGCATNVAAVTTAWPDLAVGKYPYWVLVDSDQKIAESNENDNVAYGYVQIFPNRGWLPLVAR